VAGVHWRWHLPGSAEISQASVARGIWKVLAFLKRGVAKGEANGASPFLN
jgi:hypothetical protein